MNDNSGIANSQKLSLQKKSHKFAKFSFISISISILYFWTGFFMEKGKTKRFNSLAISFFQIEKLIRENEFSYTYRSFHLEKSLSLCCHSKPLLMGPVIDSIGIRPANSECWKKIEKKKFKFLCENVLPKLFSCSCRYN